MNVNIKMTNGNSSSSKQGGVLGYFRKSEPEVVAAPTGPMSKFFECLPEEKSM